VEVVRRQGEELVENERGVRIKGVKRGTVAQEKTRTGRDRGLTNCSRTKTIIKVHHFATASRVEIKTEGQGSEISDWWTKEREVALNTRSLEERAKKE